MHEKKEIYAEIDFNLLKNSFNKEWLNLVSDIYVDHVKELSNNYFNDPGLFKGRWEKDKIIKDDVLYFNKLLYPPNYAILDYVLKNINFFKDKNIIDNGCGFGILSVFLDKIGIKCFNYDTLSHGVKMDSYNNFLKRINKKFNKQINLIETDFKDKKFDVVINSGASLDHPKLLNCGLYLLDTKKEPVCPDINYKIIKKYRPLEVRSNFLKHSV
jgi:2-polyprenyl-3-methyl-5-hydroxy-6-metoxy-1,4-benzoquinol methylase